MRARALTALCAVVASACSLSEVDLSDRACPCAAGWRCIEPENRCVRSELLDAGEDAGGADAGSMDAGPRDGGGLDAGTLDASSEDAGTPQTFGAPTRIVELDTASGEDDPTLTADMLEMLFNSSRPGGAGGGDIWRSRRPDLASPWELPTLVSELSSSDDETTPEMTADGLTVYFARSGTGTASNDVFMSTRASRSAPWSEPVPVPELSSSGSDLGPVLSADGLTAYLASTRSGGYRTWTSTRPSLSAAFRMPTEVPIASSGSQYDPFVTPDHLELWLGVGDPEDIFVARRASTSDEFSAIDRVDELATTFEDTDPWLSPDGRTIFFSSERSGNAAIWTAER